MLSRVDVASALKAGVAGTVIMTIAMYGLPLIGLPRMDIMAALGSVFPLKISPYLAGFLLHFGIGIALALSFAAFFFSWLPGPNWFKGAVFSLLPWLFAITLLGPSLQLAAQIFGAASSGSANPCALANPCAPKAANPCATKSPANPCGHQAANPCAAAANPCGSGAAPKESIPPQILSLMVHLIYGGVIGVIYRPRA
jgi:hypothetical protein